MNLHNTKITEEKAFLSYRDYQTIWEEFEQLEDDGVSCLKLELPREELDAVRNKLMRHIYGCGAAWTHYDKIANVLYIGKGSNRQRPIAKVGKYKPRTSKSNRTTKETD